MCAQEYSGADALGHAVAAPTTPSSRNCAGRCWSAGPCTFRGAARELVRPGIPTVRRARKEPS
ncbi:hypothetical protein ACFQ3Z_37270 [Streptomyces nogalater]